MRKTVTFTERTLEVSECVATKESYRKALAAAVDSKAGVVAPSESARLRQLADIGAAVVAEAAEHTGYEELAQMYSDEGNLYKSFQKSSLARGHQEDDEALDRLFDALDSR